MEIIRHRSRVKSAYNLMSLQLEANAERIRSIYMVETHEIRHVAKFNISMSKNTFFNKESFIVNVLLESQNIQETFSTDGKIPKEIFNLHYLCKCKQSSIMKPNFVTDPITNDK